MTTHHAEEFAAALNTFEGGGDLNEFVTIFADGVELTRPETTQQRDGAAGAEAFWTEYRAIFAEIHSDFSRIVDAEIGVLEWTSTGRLADGTPISYAGVSLLDYDDAGKITRFSTYFDTQAFATK